MSLNEGENPRSFWDCVGLASDSRLVGEGFMKGLFITSGVLRMSCCRHRGQAEPRPEGKRRENSTM